MWGVIDGLKPVMMMVTVQIALAGVTVLYKMAGSRGMSLQVMTAYRFLFAAASVVPFALVAERKNRPKLTWKVVSYAFFSALFGGSMAQNLYAESLALTSATFVAAMTNLVPAVTFLLAILFRMERLKLSTSAGKAKGMGTLICMGGAMLLTFYKGSVVNIWSTHFDLLQNQESGGHVAHAHHKSIDKILGPLLALGCCCSLSIALIFQAKMSDLYPCNYSGPALLSIMGSIQAVVFALCIERDWSQWKLGWDFRLLSAVYMGIIATGIMWILLMYCVRMRGPLFVSIFNPFLLVLVALASALFLDEKLHLGSILGAAVIICGLYLVLWGKGKEMKNINRLVPSTNFTEPEADHGGESFKATAAAAAVAAGPTPNFVPESNVLEVLDEDEQDLEGQISKA